MILCISGFWSSREDLLQFYRVERIFHGVEDGVRIQVRFAEWERALERFLKWREIKEPSWWKAALAAILLMAVLIMIGYFMGEMFSQLGGNLEFWE